MNNSKKSSIYAQSWSRLKQNKSAMLGLFVIGLAVCIAILGANIRPDDSPHAYNNIESLPRLKTGSEIKFLKIRKNKQITIATFWDKLCFGGQEPIYNLIPIQSYRFKAHSIEVTLYNPAIETNENENYTLANVFYPIDKVKTRNALKNSYVDLKGKTQIINSNVLQSQIEKENIITKTFWLGTDTQGRDMLSRIMAGTVVSLSVGLISVVIALVIGVFLGSVAGYYRGWADTIIMWVINIVWSIPTLLLIIAVTLVLGKGFATVFFAVGLTMWVELARIVRGQILSIREKEYIEAGKALGFSNFRIIIKHILPNIIGSIIVISASNFAAAILIEAGLSFLGIGVQIPMVSWGTMIEQHKSFITHPEKAYLALVPGLCIIFLVFAFMLLGNGLRDSFDTQKD